LCIDGLHLVERGEMHTKSFEALADGQRREVLFSMHSKPTGNRDSMAVATLCGRTHETEASELHHVHLPKLEDYGLIEWNRTSDLIAKGPRFDEIEPLLDVLADNQEVLDGILTVG
jgi:cytochrome c553